MAYSQKVVQRFEDVSIRVCAEQQTEIDELKQVIKELTNTINLTNEKE